ncbi:hypothetical protein [Flavobacterium sp.]|uniref:hypothetical protein n=1 Tax=Flavobacterium sp. TaxID=239 RepID=UPI00261F0575|nr:hypothetical protein [Flavobacterium sp.]MDG2432740.1 hypothetical protein [Flavobacterium sp.]
MKNKLLILSLLTAFFGLQMQAQSGTRVNAMTNDISDNLDLRAVADIFGDSKDLADFERRLNDPEYQISNLDLNDDNEVDYLRVIETVEGNTHVVIIQSVLARDVYQDVATIDIERNRSNNVQVQIVGNEFMYGANYIYEPVYYSTPIIYASFWSTNYRPYVSNWYWNYYPTYYTAWNPYPVFRYRSNININLNFYNSYNYVNVRRSSRAVIVYNSGRSNGYERQHPNYSFSRRNSQVANRYELDQRRGGRYSESYSRSSHNNSSRDIASRRTGRDYSENRGVTSRSSNEQRNSNSRSSSSNDNQTRRSAPYSTTNSRDYSENRSSSSRDNSSQREERTAAPQRDYSQNRSSSNNQSTGQRAERTAAPQRDYSQNRSSSNNQNNGQRAERTAAQQRDYSQNRGSSNDQSNAQRAERTAAPQRDYSQNRGSTSRQNEQQRATPQRENSQSSSSSPRMTAPTQRQEAQKSSPQGGRSNSNSRNGNRNT